eukprot:1161525-Pelagomonas_calceolata.AAC.8
MKASLTYNADAHKLPHLELHRQSKTDAHDQVFTWKGEEKGKCTKHTLTDCHTWNFTGHLNTSANGT